MLPPPAQRSAEAFAQSRLGGICSTAEKLLAGAGAQPRKKHGHSRECRPDYPLPPRRRQGTGQQAEQRYAQRRGEYTRQRQQQGTVGQVKPPGVVKDFSSGSGSNFVLGRGYHAALSGCQLAFNQPKQGREENPGAAEEQGCRQPAQAARRRSRLGLSPQVAQTRMAKVDAFQAGRAFG